jgi:ribosomal protein S18 acetylase RimI-like enzyme
VAASGVEPFHVQAGETLIVGEQRVSVRPEREEDSRFLETVYCSTREAELAPVPWPAEQKAGFLAQQFRAQTESYRNNYPGAQFLILMVDAADAGRLYLHDRTDEIRIMDIALLPTFRNHGVGSAVLKHILGEGSASNRRVSIHVEVFNPALRLYERLGFRAVASTDVYVLMEWIPRAAGLSPLAS